MKVYLPDYTDIDPNSPENITVGSVTHSTRNFATPTDVVKKLAADSKYGFSYEGSDSYITSITYAGVPVEASYDYDATTGTYISYGWNYRVYRLSLIHI